MRLWQSAVAATAGMGMYATAWAAPTTAPAIDQRPPSFDEVITRHAQPASAPPLVAPSHPTLQTTPTAPLPPALVAGPITMAVAGWISWRIRRRGNRI